MDDAAAARGQVVADALVADDGSARREVRAFDVAHQVQNAHLRLVEQSDARVQHLAQVVGRHARGKAEPDTILAVDRGRNAGWKVVRLDDLRVLLVGGHQRHGVLADVAQHDFAQPRQTHLGVAHGRRRVVIVAAEVALAVDQRVAQREVLRQPHCRVVNRFLAVRMGLAHHRPDHLGRLDRVVRRIPAHAVHEPQDPPLHWLQPVPRIWNSPRIGRHAVFGVRILNRRRELLLADLFGIKSHQPRRPDPSGARPGPETRGAPRDATRP